MNMGKSWKIWGFFLVGFIGKTGFSFKFISIPTSMVEH
jgi:hypothetical protein